MRAAIYLHRGDHDRLLEPLVIPANIEVHMTPPEQLVPGRAPAVEHFLVTDAAAGFARLAHDEVSIGANRGIADLRVPPDVIGV